MVTTQISLAAESQLAANIDIAFMINSGSSALGNPLDALFVALPWCTAINTTNLARLALGPLLKALTMNVVATSSFAPNDFVACIELYDADWTVACENSRVSNCPI
jgi:hypothetical protein